MCKTKVITTVLDTVIKSPNFGQCLRKLQIISAGLGNGNCKAQLVVSEEHLNLGGSMHGGFTSTLIDCVSSYALMSHKTNAAGVSVDLMVTFMKPALPGDLVTIDAKTIRAGRTLAFLAVDITKDDGKHIIAHGRHTKFIGEKK
ncbi:PREDICTED: acyl-coenzyme A thioesterase 13-like [Eufriesea mexicana]|uniref:acyl-coenzyme A thioesterase 13-like n=1 Tax=Eufriesea mexicana TaxID=516756 RepID=UPI00083BF74D|nr:PREDICTED: acyl-coenzyme A thioesterase 13-like [Eufriesea mexicana]XP_017762823.1 PREDICTED: acyl-coenzyme A thioesterase 13-like [Eufriesea mexicana]